MSLTAWEAHKAPAPESTEVCNAFLRSFRGVLLAKMCILKVWVRNLDSRLGSLVGSELALATDWPELPAPRLYTPSTLVQSASLWSGWLMDCCQSSPSLSLSLTHTALSPCNLSLSLSPIWEYSQYAVINLTAAPGRSKWGGQRNSQFYSVSILSINVLLIRNCKTRNHFRKSRQSKVLQPSLPLFSQPCHIIDSNDWLSTSVLELSTPNCAKIRTTSKCCAPSWEAICRLLPQLP